MPGAMEPSNSRREIGIQTNIVLGTLNVKFVIQDSEEDSLFTRQFTGFKSNPIINGASEINGRDNPRDETAKRNGHMGSSPLTSLSSHQVVPPPLNLSRPSESVALPVYPPLSVLPSFGHSAFPTLPTSALTAGCVTSTPLSHSRQSTNRPVSRSERVLHSVQHSTGRETLPLASKQILRKPRKVVNPRPRNLLSRPWLANAVRTAATAAVQKRNMGVTQSSGSLEMSRPVPNGRDSMNDDPSRCASVEVRVDSNEGESGGELTENEYRESGAAITAVRQHGQIDDRSNPASFQESHNENICHSMTDTKSDCHVDTKEQDNCEGKSHGSIVNGDDLHSTSSEGNSDSVSVKEEPHDEDYESCRVTNSSDSEGQNLDAHEFSPVGGDTSVDSSMMSPNAGHAHNHDHRDISPTTQTTSTPQQPTLNSAVNSLAALSGMNSEQFFEKFIGRNLGGADHHPDSLERRHSFENGSAVFPSHGAFPQATEDMNSSAPANSFFTSYQPKGTFLNKEERDQRKERYKEFYRELTIIDNETGRRKPKFECRLCNAVASRKDRMIDHIEFKHFNIRSYPCDGCNVKFSTYSNLAQHRKKQHGLDGVDVPRGPATYTDQGLRMDKAIHVRHLFFKIQDYNNTGFMNKSFQCKLCSYRSTRTDRMVVHIESHHREHI